MARTGFNPEGSVNLEGQEEVRCKTLHFERSVLEEEFALLVAEELVPDFAMVSTWHDMLRARKYKFNL